MAGRRTPSPTTNVEGWGVEPGKRVWVGGHNLDARREIELHLAGTERPPTGPIDLAFVAPRSTDEAVYFAGKLRSRLAPTGLVWIVYPNPCSPREAEFTGDFEEMVVALFERGFSEAGRAPVGDNYTSTAFQSAGLSAFETDIAS